MAFRREMIFVALLLTAGCGGTTVPPSALNATSSEENERADGLSVGDTATGLHVPILAAKTLSRLTNFEDQSSSLNSGQLGAVHVWPLSVI